MKKVELAQPLDVEAWLVLAKEVEPLFGPMVGEPSFHRALQKNIERSTACCVRKHGGAPGAMLLGGLLFSVNPPTCEIGWLAVTKDYRRQGIGQQLVQYVIQSINKPATISVTTFGPENSAGAAARGFYEHMAFTPKEKAPDGPEGKSRQIFQRYVS